MAAYWDDRYDDEEWLKNQSSAKLYQIYRVAVAEGKETAKIKNLLSGGLDKIAALESSDDIKRHFAELSLYDTLAYIRYIKDEKREDETKVLDTMRTGSVFQAKAVNDKYEAAGSKLADNLSWQMQMKAAAQIDYLVEENETSQTQISQLNAMIEEQLKKARDEISDELFDNYEAAEYSGALDDISEESKNAFLDQLAKLVGLENVDAAVIENNDNSLARTVDSLEVYNGEGNLNPLYEDCAELADKLQFEFPENMPEEKQAELARAYKQQLLANAAQRATYEVLKNRGHLVSHRTNEEIVAAYKEEIARQFERGVVLAGLAGNEETGVMLEDIVLEKGKVVYKGEKDNIADAMKQILDGKVKIHPLAVAMDTDDLNRETRQVEKILGRKRIDPNRLKFHQKAKKLVAAVWDNVIKKGGWKQIASKVGLNMAMFGVSSALMAGAAPAVVAGITLYAGWTTVNAWVSPVYDKLNAEMAAKGITGRKERRQYRKENWKRVRQEKYAEPKFKARAWRRTAEGIIVGGLSAGLGAFGIGGLTKTVSRQGLMAAGKMTNLIDTLFGSRRAKKSLAQNRTVKNIELVQYFERLKKQDKVALASVIGGAMVADYFKYEAMENGEIAQVAEINETLQSVANPENISLGTGGNTASLDSANVVSPADPLQQEVPADSPETSAPAGEDITDGAAAGSEPENPAGGISENVEAARSFDASTLSDTEKRMYLNSIKKWDNNALANRIADLEKSGTAINAETKQILDNALADNFIGKTVVQGFYDAIENGKVETLPEGVSAVEYVDKLTRLAQLAPYAQREAIEIMMKDLVCEDFHPSAEQIEVVKNALNTIVYEKGSRECIIPDAEGNLCVKNMPMFGQYIGNQQMAKIEINGEVRELPLRNANVTTGLDKDVNCNEGTARIISTYKVNTIPGCGCPKQDEIVDQVAPQDAPAPAAEPVVEDNAAPEPQKTEVKLDFKNPGGAVKGTAVYSGEGSNFGIDSTVDEKAQFLRMDNKGNLHVWQNVVTMGDKATSIGGGVEALHPVPLDLNMENLGGAKITDTETLMTVQYGEGKGALRFEINKESGLVNTFVGKQEVILDEETAKQAAETITKSLNEGGLDKTYAFTQGDEAEQASEAAEKFADKIEAKKGRIETRLNNQIENAVERGGREETEVVSTVADKETETPAAEGAAGHENTAVSREAANASEADITTIPAADTAGQEAEAGTQNAAETKVGDTVVEDVSTELGRLVAQTMHSFTETHNYYLDTLKIYQNSQGQYMLNDTIVSVNLDETTRQRDFLALTLSKEELFAQQMDAKASEGGTLNEAETDRLDKYEQLLKSYNLERPKIEDTGKSGETLNLDRKQQNPAQTMAAAKARGGR